MQRQALAVDLLFAHLMSGAGYGVGKIGNEDGMSNEQTLMHSSVSDACPKASERQLKSYVHNIVLLYL